MRNGVTYGDLERFLRRMGFVPRESTGVQRVFWHEPSDTLVVLPGTPEHVGVGRAQLAAVRRTLFEKGLIDCDSLDGLLQAV